MVTVMVMLTTRALTPVDAKAVATMVRYLVETQHPLAVDRGGFATLGASAYLDDPARYPALAERLNPYTTLFFGSLILSVTLRVADMVGLSRERISPTDTKGLPGFHFFGPLSNGMQGSIHTDEPHMRCGWPSPVVNTHSFTLALELPTAGGGLDIWDADVSDPNISGNGNFEYVPYSPGMLYVHSGSRYHRISSSGRLHVEDARITLQGHLAELEDAQLIAYF